MNTASLVCNLFIFAVTAIITLRFFWKDGMLDVERGKNAFRYFTVQSNVLCGLSALLLCLFPASHRAWLFKYMGTAAVTVTLLTVFFFLGPNIGYGKLLKGPDLFMHLITPLVAIVSFCVLEKRGLTFAEALLGMLPSIVYGVWYLYKVVLAPAEKRWEDFYGFNKGGKWPVYFVAMTVGELLICLGLMALQNV